MIQQQYLFTKNKIEIKCYLLPITLFSNSLQYNRDVD